MNSSAQVVKLRPNAKSKATDPFIERYHQSVNSPEYTHFFKEYPLGVSWKLTGEVLLRDLIASGKSPVEKIHTLQDTLLFSVDQDDRQLQELTFQCWNRFFEKRGTPLLSLPEELQESKFCLNRKAFEWKNRHYSLDFFSKLNLTLEIAEATKAGLHPESFLEIGAGFGQLARLIKLKYPKGRYAILDLPEALYFSSNYLFLNFPQAKHVWANDERELKRALEEADYDFLYVPAPLSQCLKQSKFEFDAAVNKSSFGEMNNKSSGYYIELLQKHLNVKYVFLLNRFLNSMDPDLQSYRR